MTPLARWFRRRGLPARGAAAIEFGLTLPVFIVFTAATFEYGVYFQKNALVSNATAEAVRYAAFRDNPAADADTRVRSILQNYGLDCGVITCTINATRVDDATIDYLELKVKVDYVPLTDLVPVPSDFAAQAVVPVIEQTP